MNQRIWKKTPMLLNCFRTNENYDSAYGGRWNYRDRSLMISPYRWIFVQTKTSGWSVLHTPLSCDNKNRIAHEFHCKDFRDRITLPIISVTLLSSVGRLTNISTYDWTARPRRFLSWAFNRSNLIVDNVFIISPQSLRVVRLTTNTNIHPEAPSDDSALSFL